MNTVPAPQVEDQVQSIQQLRQTQSSREREEQSRMMEWERKQQELQLQLEQEGEANTDLQVRTLGELIPACIRPYSWSLSLFSAGPG